MLTIAVGDFWGSELVSMSNPASCFEFFGVLVWDTSIEVGVNKLGFSQDSGGSQHAEVVVKLFACRVLQNFIVT